MLMTVLCGLSHIGSCGLQNFVVVSYISKKHTTSIFRQKASPEDGGSTFIQNVSVHLSHYNEAS
jgi:hypothetical protein